MHPVIAVLIFREANSSDIMKSSSLLAAVAAVFFPKLTLTISAILVNAASASAVWFGAYMQQTLLTFRGGSETQGSHLSL